MSFSSIKDVNNNKVDYKHLFQIFFDGNGTYRKNVPQSLKRQDHVRDAFKNCYNGDNKSALYLEHFGTELLDDICPIKKSSIFQGPFSIVNGKVDVGYHLQDEWSISSSAMSTSIMKLAFRFVLQYSKVVGVANSTEDFEIVDNYPSAFQKNSKSLTYVLHCCGMTLKHQLKTYETGVSLNSARISMWKSYVKKFFEADHYAALQVLTIPVYWKNVQTTIVQTDFGSYPIATRVRIESLPNVPKKLLPEFVALHGGGAQTMNSDYLFNYPMKDKYMDRLASIYLLSKAKQDVSVLANTQNNFIRRHTFDKDVDVTGSYYDCHVDLSNPTQVGTNDRTLERQKRSSALLSLLKRGIALKVVYIDELPENFELPSEYGYARYPVPHQAKVVIFKKSCFELKEIPLETAIKYTVAGLIARQYRWSGLRVNLVDDITLNFAAEIVDTTPIYDEVDFDKTKLLDDVVGPYDTINPVPSVSTKDLVINESLETITLIKQGTTSKVSVKKSESNSLDKAKEHVDDDVLELRKAAISLHSGLIVNNGISKSDVVTSTTSTTTTMSVGGTASSTSSIAEPVIDDGTDPGDAQDLGMSFV
jgi:hypothetical protein